MSLDLTISSNNGGGNAYANDKLYFSASFIGGPILSSQINSKAMQIQGNVNIKDIIPIYYEYSFNTATKYMWRTQDGYVYSTQDIEHIFKVSGTYSVAVTVVSEQQFYQGIPFNFLYTVILNVNVTSFFFKLITKNIPMWQYDANNQANNDLITACAQFFDNVYSSIQGVYKLIDIENVDPSYFNYLAITLGHNLDYARKIGSDVNNSSFDTYDIFQNIINGVATTQEINAFRQFLLLSVDIFKTGGTPDQVRTFLSLFNITAQSKDLWTQNWGLTSKGIIDENFIGLDTFVDNSLGLQWDNILVVGNNNDECHLTKNFNSFTLDNYHTVQKLQYANDIVQQDSVYSYFNIYNNFPIFKDIRRENGDLIVSEDITSSYYDIVVNENTETNRTYPYLLKVETQYLEDGDIISVNYQTTTTDSVDSIVANVDTPIMNMDYSVRFKYLSIPSTFENTNEKIQDNEIFLAFRGVQTATEAYDNFNEYYRVSLNAKNSTITLSKVILNSTNNTVITQEINLNQNDISNPIFEKLILNGKEIESFKYNTAYDLKISIIGSTISAYYKEAKEFNIITSKIEANEGDVPFGKILSTWIPLFENININITDTNVRSLDNNGQIIPSYAYSSILVPGYYGVGVRNSSIEIIEIYLNNLDLDTTLYTDTQKELSIKPKYLEWQDPTLLQFNSYADHKDDTFGSILSASFAISGNTYTLQPNQTAAFNFIYFDNAPLTEEIASRYTVSFDQNWVNTNFKNEQDVMNKIIVPFGSQPSWFAVESRVYDKNFYLNYYGETTPTHNLGTSIVNAPGYFNYNLSTTLGLYKTEPLDELSSVTRIDSRDDRGVLLSSAFQANEKIQQYKLSNSAIKMNGLFEEVCPNSTIFSNDEMCGVETNQSGVTFSNPLFFPIIVNNNNSQRIIGVRFKNCSDISNILARQSQSGSLNVQLYGLFVMQLPIEAIQNRPDLTKSIEVFAGDESTVLIKMFLPLGALNAEIQNYSLSTEYMHDVVNSGPTAIALDGVYTIFSRDLMVYIEQDSILNLPSLNPYENDAQALKCRYYLSANLSLATNLNDYEPVSSGIANKYMMNYDFRKMLNSLGKGCENFDSFLWWVPKELWRKRDFNILNLDVANDIATGLNYDGSSDKYFYGTKVNKNAGLNSLRLAITDGPITPYTTYYAKIKFQMSWNGFAELFLGNASLVDGSVKPARPLTAAEAANVITLGGNSQKYLNSIMAPVAECLDFYVPISWYPESDIPSNNVLEWGNYLRGVNGTTSGPSVSLTPYGLMTYFLTHATDANFQSIDLSQVTAGWTLKDWNERFMQFVKIEYVAELIPTSAYKLYDEFGFVSKYAPQTGAKINIEYNAGNIKEWKVIDNVTMYPQGYNSYYFNIPAALYRLANWVQDITDMKISNYVIPLNLYSIKNNVLTLNNDNLFSIMKGGTLKTSYSFDDLFGKPKDSLVQVDNFSDTRQITWINYQENHFKDVLELAIRSPNETLFTTGIDPLLSITTLNGVNVLQNSIGNTINAYNPLLNGVSFNGTGNVVVAKDPNGGYVDTVSLIDEQHDVFSLETLVWFDSQLNSLQGYNGKHFEYIFKAETTFNPSTNTFILSSYYFVGIGTYTFDVALGVAKFNPITNTMDKTFLAGYGNYNTNNISTNTWYKLKILVNSKYIRVLYNKATDLDTMVIKYNIDVNEQQNMSRYIDGDFEQLVYLITGLENLKITYPNNLQAQAGTTFYNENFNSSWAANVRPNGLYTGIRLYNPYTYVQNVTYSAAIQDNKTFATANELLDLTSIIQEIENYYTVNGTVTFVGKTANGGIIVLYGTDLFNKIPNQFIAKRYSDVQNVYIADNKVVIRFNSSNKLILTVVDETFTNVQNVYIKDNYFNTDHIYKYMLWTDREIDNIYATPNNLYVTFTDA